MTVRIIISWLNTHKHYNTHKHKWNEENFIHRGADFQNIRRRKKKGDGSGGGGEREKKMMGEAKALI